VGVTASRVTPGPAAGAIAPAGTSVLLRRHSVSFLTGPVPKEDQVEEEDRRGLPHRTPTPYYEDTNGEDEEAAARMSDYLAPPEDGLGEATCERGLMTDVDDDVEGNFRAMTFQGVCTPAASTSARIIRPQPRLGTIHTIVEHHPPAARDSTGAATNMK